MPTRLSDLTTLPPLAILRLREQGFVVHWQRQPLAACIWKRHLLDLIDIVQLSSLLMQPEITRLSYLGKQSHNSVCVGIMHVHCILNFDTVELDPS